MHTLPLFCPTPCIPFHYSIPPHAHPLPILSHPCMPSPYSIPPHAYPPRYSIPAHAYPPPILSHPMHTFPLFYPTPCIPSPYSIPAHAHPPPILCQPIHTPPYFLPPHACPLSILFHPYMPSFILSHCMGVLSCSLPAHTCIPSILFHLMHAPPNSLSHEPGRQVSPLTSENATFESVHTEYIIIIIIYLA